MSRTIPWGCFLCLSLVTASAGAIAPVESDPIAEDPIDSDTSSEAPAESDPIVEDRVDSDTSAEAPAESDSIAENPAESDPSAEAPAQSDPIAEAPDHHTALDEAYSLKARGDLTGATRAFERALSTGAAPQLVALELGFLAATQGEGERARRHFEDAASGEDLALVAQAKRELDALEPLATAPALPQRPLAAGTPSLGYVPPPDVADPSRWWGDLYAEAYGWHRLAGPELADDIVFTLRLRGLYRLSTELDLDAYVLGQATRDLASKAGGESKLPVIYADNHATAALGLMLRTWERRVGLFAQAGPSARLVQDGNDHDDLDIRAGAFLALETPQCASRPSRSEFVVWPCAEVYSEAVYVNRYEHNLIGFARGRAGFSYWVTGPLLSQLVFEVRGGLDRNQDYYNNFIDAGGGQRFRFVDPIRFDVMLGAHAGSYLGVEGRDPAPSSLGYLELRLQAATYVEF